MTAEERARAVAVLEKEFGPQWQSIVQMLGTENLRRRVGKELTSFIAYPDRGDGGSNAWRGNCSPKVVEAVANMFWRRKSITAKTCQTSPSSIR